ncbi:MAG: acetyl-CoA carboxylase biotin carboxyl carrier protein [Gaiellaceae bacterium]
MQLSDDDVREILRLIDESDVEELRVETEEFSLHVVRGGAAAVPHEVAAPAPAGVETPAPAHDALQTVAAPMLGTFYRAQAPGAPPFVDIGARVAEDTVVCLIEVMKMMNPVPAGVVGTIVEVCVENAELVEDGAVLFRVRGDS